MKEFKGQILLAKQLKPQVCFMIIDMCFLTSAQICFYQVEGPLVSSFEILLTLFMKSCLTSFYFYFFNSQEDANRGKPNWEHLADDLHVLITVEDTENRAKLKLQRAVEEVQKLLVPVSFEKFINFQKINYFMIRGDFKLTASRR